MKCWISFLRMRIYRHIWMTRRQFPVKRDGMKEYIEEGRMADYQDHYYPTEMAVDAQIQTFLMKKDKDAFLKKFDTDWTRYNRDIIRKVQDYEEKNGEGEN